LASTEQEREEKKERDATQRRGALLGTQEGGRRKFYGNWAIFEPNSQIFEPNSNGKFMGIFEQTV
jgi:hypothetical protein